MPKHPIYTAMLPETALAVLGATHPSGRAAVRMLEKEGFAFDRYVDVFDGGPTMTAATDTIATLREASEATVIAIADDVEGSESLVATGRLDTFRASYGRIVPVVGGMLLNATTARAIGAAVGDQITHVPR